jgi:hypothetical protein
MMGKRKMNTEQLTLRIDVNLLNELKSINPSLLTPSTKSDVEFKFRYGALGKYIARLIRKDIDERKEKAQLDVLDQFK